MEGRFWFSREEDGMKKDIRIVDRGRGLQLSTSRITVQDLVPYFQDGCSYEEIGEAFGIAKTTAMRRMKKGTSLR